MTRSSLSHTVLLLTSLVLGFASIAEAKTESPSSAPPILHAEPSSCASLFGSIVHPAPAHPLPVVASKRDLRFSLVTPEVEAAHAAAVASAADRERVYRLTKDLYEDLHERGELLYTAFFRVKPNTRKLDDGEVPGWTPIELLAIKKGWLKVEQPEAGKYSISGHETAPGKIRFLEGPELRQLASEYLDHAIEFYKHRDWVERYIQGDYANRPEWGRAFLRKLNSLDRQSPAFDPEQRDLAERMTARVLPHLADTFKLDDMYRTRNNIKNELHAFSGSMIPKDGFDAGIRRLEAAKPVVPENFAKWSVMAREYLNQLHQLGMDAESVRAGASAAMNPIEALRINGYRLANDAKLIHGLSEPIGPRRTRTEKLLRKGRVLGQQEVAELQGKIKERRIQLQQVLRELGYLHEDLMAVLAAIPRGPELLAQSKGVGANEIMKRGAPGESPLHSSLALAQLKTIEQLVQSVNAGLSRLENLEVHLRMSEGVRELSAIGPTSFDQLEKELDSFSRSMNIQKLLIK